MGAGCRETEDHQPWESSTIFLLQQLLRSAILRPLALPDRGEGYPISFEERRCAVRDLVDRAYARLTVRDEEGQGMVEYGLIIALVAIVVIAALVILGPKIGNIFNQAGNKL